MSECRTSSRLASVAVSRPSNLREMNSLRICEGRAPKARWRESIRTEVARSDDLIQRFLSLARQEFIVICRRRLVGSCGDTARSAVTPTGRVIGRCADRGAVWYCCLGSQSPCSPVITRRLAATDSAGAHPPAAAMIAVTASRGLSSVGRTISLARSPARSPASASRARSFETVGTHSRGTHIGDHSLC
jgi:hypothetical protein